MDFDNGKKAPIKCNRKRLAGIVQGNTNIGQERQEIHQTRSNKNWHWELTEELAKPQSNSFRDKCGKSIVQHVTTNDNMMPKNWLPIQCHNTNLL